MPSTTKDRIARTLVDMTRTRPVDKITVKDLVEACSITRQTFYYHFQDLMDVIEWIMQRRMEELTEKSLEMDSVRGVMELFVSSSMQDRDIIRKLLSSQKWESAEHLMVRALRTYLQELLDGHGLCSNVGRLDLEVTLDFYAYAIAGTLLEAARRPRVDEALLADQLARLLTGKMVIDPEERGAVRPAGRQY